MKTFNEIFIPLIDILHKDDSRPVRCTRNTEPKQTEPEFYGDLVYRIRKNVGISNFSEQFRKLIDSYALLFNCTAAFRASDSMTVFS